MLAADADHDLVRDCKAEISLARTRAARLLFLLAAAVEAFVFVPWTDIGTAGLGLSVPLLTAFALTLASAAFPRWSVLSSVLVLILLHLPAILSRESRVTQ